MVGVIIGGMENGGEKMVYLVAWLSGKRGEILVGSRAQKSNFPFDEKIKEILVSFASVFTIIFLSSLTMFNTSTATSVLWFILFSSVLLIVFCWIFFFFLTLHFYHHTITFTACIFMFCAIPFQLAKVHDFFPQHGSIYCTIPFNFYLTKYNKFNYKEKK